MFIIGIVIHLVFLFSIFDIYFKSPVVKNATTYQPLHEALADRLVLFVIDGLRAESFVNYTTMLYLRSIANNHGRWGISHTRVPTESRPGHVAIIAGFYEDPSAIAKGWKENPVDFDSVFNQTAYTWCWGTYDILEIFTRGAINKNIFVEKFDPYDQSFSSDKNTTLLDDWVFTRVKNFFLNAQYDDNLRRNLQSKRIVFFLHLLGTDTAGHTHKPKTKNFLTTIKYVDEQIQEIEQIIKDFYDNDGKTTFLMTSDHGMTDWGSHGTGDDDETKTPYVLWGAGVQQVRNNKQRQVDHETNSMDSTNRYDINQADLTPLMSSFLSIPVPINSIGQLPSELLDMSLPNKAKAIYSNSRQMLSQYNKKRLDVEANAISLLYKPFELFNGNKVQEITSFTEKLLEDGHYEEVIKLSEEIMHLSLTGLAYYHNYYQKPLLITVTLSFIGWIVCLLRFLVEQNIFSQTELSRNKHKLAKSSKTIDFIIKIFSASASVMLSGIIHAQCLPLQYYIYFLMPIFLWFYALTPINLWMQILSSLKNKKRMYILGIEILCYTFGSMALGLALTHRWVLTVPLLGMSLWPFFSSSIQNLPTLMCYAWPIGCVSLSVFSFMSVIGKDTWIELVILAGLMWLIMHSLYIWKFSHSDIIENKDVLRENIIGIIQIISLALSLLIIYTQSRRFEENLPISKLLQSVCWIISVLLPLYPLLYTKKFINRLVGINTTILTFYLLLSVAHEGLFMVSLIFNINCWMFIEFKLLNFRNIKIAECTFEAEIDSTDKKHLPRIERSINSQDFRRAFFYTSYIILAYFGTGNIASLNSFEVRWVLCFTTSFQPFVMTGLILLKTLSPFLSVACTFRAIQYLTKAPSGYLNMIVLIYSNVMGLQMLYHVRNTGSWLEIGTSISQYVIVQVITLFIVLINQIAKVLSEIEIHHSLIKLFKNRKKYV